MSITPPSLALVQCYAPELEKRCRPHVKATVDSWKVDETYIKVKIAWMYLYRAVGAQGNTLEFFLSPTRDAQAAKDFFLKTLAASHTSELRVINVDKHAAYPKAFAELKRRVSLLKTVNYGKVNPSIIWSNKIIASSNGEANRIWASSPSRPRGEHYKGSRS